MKFSSQEGTDKQKELSDVRVHVGKADWSMWTVAACIDHCIATPSSGARSGAELETRTERGNGAGEGVGNGDGSGDGAGEGDGSAEGAGLRAFEQLATPLNCV